MHDIINRYNQIASLSVSSFMPLDNKARDCLTERDLSDSDTLQPLYEEPVSDRSAGDRIIDRALKSRDEHAYPWTSYCQIDLDGVCRRRWGSGLDGKKRHTSGS